MAVIETLTDETYDCEIVIESDGWSGEVVRFQYGEEEPQFQFDITGDVHGDGEYFSCTPSDGNYGYIRGSADIDGCYIGISLEHMGRIYDTDTEIAFSACGNHPYWQPGGAFGAKPTDTKLRVTCSEVYVRSLDCMVRGEPSTYENHALGRYFQYSNNVGIIFWRCAYVGSGQWTWRATIKTDLPIFRTDADLLEYCQSGGTVTDKILNIAEEPDPEEEYNKQFAYWYVKNRWAKNTRNPLSNMGSVVNYRFYPKRKGICFVKHTPTSAAPYDRILYQYDGYEAKFAEWGVDDDDDFIDNPGEPQTHYITKNISFGSNDYYTQFGWDTNIPLWNTQQDADDYFNGLKDITEADNYAYIARQDNTILNPDLPGTEIDEATAVRTNGMRFGYGVRLYEITNVELSNLMQEMYDPANVEDVIEGNKLVGSATINAISSVMYLPFPDLSEICELGSEANIKIGSWEAQTAHGKRIISNEGTIDCGSFFYNRVYKDYRDYEPYNLLFAVLPFCGSHQLTISKFLDRTVSCRYNVDVATGGIVCSLYADDILVDVFEGTCGASRPISATDNNAYINSIMSAITGASTQASGSVEGISNVVGGVGKAANVGAAAGGAAAFGATLYAGAIGASGIYTAYQIKNAVDNPPQIHRGSLAGNLGYYLNSKPTFLFFSKRTIRPEKELETVGYPSGHGGTVRSFSGYLKCSVINIEKFPGTAQELADIHNLLANGIYLN